MARHLSMHAWPGPVTEVGNHRAPCWAKAPGPSQRQPQAQTLALNALLTPWCCFKVTENQLIGKEWYQT